MGEKLLLYISIYIRIYIYIYIYTVHTGVGKSKFAVVRMEKDMQVIIIITIAKIDKS
jgi:hypothetical protein